MKKKILLLVAILTMCFALTACTEANQVSYNVSKEANNFNVTRKITVVNIRSDKVLFEMVGTFSIMNSGADELEIICQVGENDFKKHYIYLNEWTSYVVEDISGANVDKYHYELNILPEWGVTVTHSK